MSLEMSEPIFGYRQFYYDYNGSGMLHGLFGAPWPTAEMEAECLCTVARPDHTCGIYLLREPVHSVEVYIGAFCTAWGRVIEHEMGWRVQYCRIERLILPLWPDPRLLSAIPLMESRYRVPVVGSGRRD
jgi:hypothetical protein